MESRIVLFVDDEPAVLDGLKRAMRTKLKNLEACFLSSSKAALEFVRHRKPDVVVSDIQMPELNGLELVSRIREMAPATRTIMLTGKGDLDAALNAINNAEVYRFYTKPCDPDTLAEGIFAALEKDSAETNTISFRSSIGTAALNHLKMAILIVDEKGHIVFTNSAGAALFAEEDGLSWGQDNKPRTQSPEETRQLHSLLDAACNNDNEKLGDGVLAISRKFGQRPLSAAISSLHDDAPRQHAIMFVSDPGCPNVLAPESISKLFSLTPAEAKLTHTLAQGEQLTDAAEFSGITVSTARTYLKQIFQKTDTTRQSELIKLVLSAGASHQ